MVYFVSKVLGTRNNQFHNQYMIILMTSAVYNDAVGLVVPVFVKTVQQKSDIRKVLQGTSELPILNMFLLMHVRTFLAIFSQNYILTS